MRIIKIALAALVFFGLASCANNHEGYVPESDYQEIVKEYKELKANSDATREQFIEEAEAMDSILQELSGISGKTSALRSNIEQGTARITQAEQIEANIKDIKKKLSDLDKLSTENASYKRLVKSLREVIAEKENEIESLKSAIASRDRKISEQSETINAQHGTIQSQSETISNQQEELRIAVQEQAKLLYQAGVDFEELGDSSPSVSFRRNKEKIKGLTREMYEKSIVYYSKALETGFPEAEYRISAVREKISLLSE